MQIRLKTLFWELFACVDSTIYNLVIKLFFFFFFTSKHMPAMLTEHEYEVLRVKLIMLDSVITHTAVFGTKLE